MTTPVSRSADLMQFLGNDFAQPADPAWRQAFAPQLSYGRHSAPPRSNARLAAVAMVLCWDGTSWRMPLTVRSAKLTHHSGQVSLPGGLVEANETARDAAARELTEELRQSPALEWLGDLAPLFVYASNSLVTPCVAAAYSWPAWNPDPAEVDRVLPLSLEDLVDQPPAKPLVVHRGPVQFSAPQLIVENHSVWGATAVLLGDLRGRLCRISRNRFAPRG